MRRIGRGVPSLTLAIISSQSLGSLGLQNILECVDDVRIAVRLHQRMTSVLLGERRPDVFILDMEAQQDAVGTIRQIRESAPESRVVLLSGFEDADHTREALTHGADSVILKIQPPAVALAAIMALYSSTVHHHGGIKHDDTKDLGPRATARQDADLSKRRAVWPEGLTERQREIIRLIGQGLSNKDIADLLYISDSTVRHHLTGIFQKTGLPNRHKLLIHAHQVTSSAA